MKDILYTNRPKINIEFQNIKYDVSVGSKAQSILKNIHGNFKSGHISAILGPSGAGKTTLLNILAGYTTLNTSGTILINGQPRNLKLFNKISRYILQESLIHPYITVTECMQIAASFKLGCCSASKEEKLKIIQGILKTLRLSDAENTYTECLSGGEKKRLTIALELIDNPPIIFLDEPTSGLDEMSSFQCISLLRQLAEDNRTVIISIHQPSAKLFAQLQQVYVITQGQCVYQGLGSEIVPFLNRINLSCPVHYNPIDFLIDVSCGEYGQRLDELVELTKNGKLSFKEDNVVESFVEDTYLDINEVIKNMPPYYSSFSTQICTFLKLSSLQSIRNTSYIFTRLIMLIIVILTFSLLFVNVGNNAALVKSSVSYLFLTLVTFVYLAMMPTLVQFPNEIKSIRAEYFNKWFHLKTYFLSKCVTVLPFYIFFCSTFTFFTYPITDQPLDCNRMMQFILTCVLICMVTDATSQIIGSIFDSVNSLFFGMAAMAPIVIFGVQGFGHKLSLEPLFVQYIINTSFVRIGLEGLVVTIYSNRENLHCPEGELFCPLTNTDHLIQAFGFTNYSYWTTIIILLFNYVLMKVIAFFILKERLRPTRFTNICYSILCYFKEKFDNSNVTKHYYV